MDNDKFLNFIEAYREVSQELESVEQARRNSSEAVVYLEDVLSIDEITITNGSVPLGIAPDKLPVLFNTWDAYTPNILVQGRRGSDVLKVVADYAMRHAPTRMEFLVLTNYPDNWSNLRDRTGACIGVLPFYSNEANNAILALASKAHESRRIKHPIILLIDGFDAVENMNIDTRNYLIWLLERGSAKRMFTFASMEQAGMRDWHSYFGCIFVQEESSSLFSIHREDGTPLMRIFVPQTHIGEICNT